MEGTEQAVKPDWKDAPEWANYLAQEYDGSWFWFELKPTADYQLETWIALEGRCNQAFKKQEWASTLEQRPKQ